MSRHVLFARPDNEFTEICRLFFEMGIHHLPVVNDQGELLGMISANDLLKAFTFTVPKLEKSDEKSLNRIFQLTEVMTPTPLHTIRPDHSVKEAAKSFADYKIHALPVIEKGKVVGIITADDLIESLAGVEEALRFI